MLGFDSMVPLGVVVFSPPKMFGCDEEREPSGKVASWPPKMLGREEERPLGLVQSWPPKTFGWQDTWAAAGPGRRSAKMAAAANDVRRSLMFAASGLQVPNPATKPHAKSTLTT